MTFKKNTKPFVFSSTFKSALIFSMALVSVCSILSGCNGGAETPTDSFSEVQSVKVDVNEFKTATFDKQEMMSEDESFVAESTSKTTVESNSIT